MSFWENILVGVVSGIVATVIFFLVMLLVKPMLIVSEEICKKNAEKPIYQIKVVNLSKHMLTNLRYSLQYAVSKGDGINEVINVPPLKDCLFFVDKYDKNDKESKYAIRISFKINESKQPLNESGCYIFTFFAQHSVSNTVTCIRQVYKSGNIIQGVFETGKSTKILRA